jgi:hypothetical protein
VILVMCLFPPPSVTHDRIQSAKRTSA